MHASQLALFPAANPLVSPVTVTHLTSEELERRATAAIDAVLEAGHPMICAWSSGKDSSVVANLMLNAARSRLQRGESCPPLLINHSSITVENPEVQALASSEIEKIRAYAADQGIPLTVRIGHPTLYSAFACRVISGRGLPTFPDTRGDCSVDWKVRVGDRLTAEAYTELRRFTEKPAVLMTGVRREESAARAASIASRGERDEGIWTNAEGEMRLSPILSWTSDDVWTYLGYCAAGLIPSYSDFAETMRFYRDAGGSSCVVVASDMMDARKGGGCGARSGCVTCTKVQSDKSLMNMIESDDGRYGYMKPMLAFRDFIANTQYDWSRRSYVGRTIDKDGYITIAADTYAPQMLEDLLWYALSIQATLPRAANFRYVALRELFAIDMLWSAYGLHKPFHALWIAREVERGNLKFPPKVKPVPKTPVPAYGRIFVGKDWDGIDTPKVTGLFDAPLALAEEGCGIGTRFTRDGRVVTDFDTTKQFEVDEEGALLFLEFEADRHIAEFHRDDAEWTAAARIYLRYGFVTLAKGAHARWDGILRRTEWRQQNCLHGQPALEHLIARCEAPPVRQEEALFAEAA
ncbi:phosphoadenosine phosphosulfate reductase family protein [Cupriavidus sp. TMH.W2]|uniref:phosphoadenosine phosphosulfate reductase domain-containing protein n=1 Tax=Cupriavidus sp. TMH.W2 TaxID=3434465 RepID=UPI003D7740E0